MEDRALSLCYSDQVLGQLALLLLWPFCIFQPVRLSHSMWLMIASSSFVSHRWYWSPTSRGVLIRSQSKQALFTPPFLGLGASPDWGRQCIPRVDKTAWSPGLLPCIAVVLQQHTTIIPKFPIKMIVKIMHFNRLLWWYYLCLAILTNSEECHFSSSTTCLGHMYYDYVQLDNLSDISGYRNHSVQ